MQETWISAKSTGSQGGVLRKTDVELSLRTSQQFDSAQLISSLVARTHLVERMRSSGRMFDLAGSYGMHV